MNYLESIKRALTNFYMKDIMLFSTSMHEMTFCFRIAKYLSEQLENTTDNKTIDCEYHSSPNGHKNISVNGKDRDIRPDIIFHKRSKYGEPQDNNVFVLEVKIKSPGDDIKKVQATLSRWNYKQGFCICNVGKKYITVIEVVKGKEPIKHRYRIYDCGFENVRLEEKS